MTNISLQRERAEEAFKKDYEKLLIRKKDLDDQLESMMEKFKVILQLHLVNENFFACSAFKPLTVIMLKGTYGRLHLKKAIIGK